MINHNNLKNLQVVSSKQLLWLNIFWSGFITYTASYAIKAFLDAHLRLFELTQAIGIILFLPAAIMLAQFKIKNSYLKFIFGIYCIWELLVISRGIHFSHDAVKTMLINANRGIFLYLAPVILLFPSNLNFYKKLFDVIIVAGIFFLIYEVLFIRDLLDRSPATRDLIEVLVNFLGIPCGFILLTYKYHSNNKKIIAFGVMMLSFLFAVYKARRGLSTICLSILLSSYFLYLFTTKKKIFLLYISILAVITGVFYVSNIYDINNNKLFGFIAKRGDTDTRTGVELYLFNDMKEKDWAIGKGINGEYFCPDIEDNQVTNFRSYIETGYLQIILKGGIIRLILYLLITIPAVFSGLFNSKNILSKGAAIWILISLLSLYPATVNTFSLHFLMVWLSVGICYSRQIRRLSDDTLKHFFREPYQID